MITISVCMATYNGFPYLVRQIESVMAQLGPEDQLVVSDNGSTDATVGYLDSLKDPRVLVLTFPSPKSPVRNLENALKHATRPVVVLADQDDVWFENRLPLIRRAFHHRNPSLLCFVGDGERIDQSGRTTCRSNLEALKFRKGFFKNIYRNSYMGCTMSVGRGILKLALPFPRSIPMHDSWIGLLAEQFGTVEVLPEHSYAYRVHRGNLSHKKLDWKTKVRHRTTLTFALLDRIVRIRLGLHTGGDDM